jgi:Protein of unknown function (DUF1592)/Protein of unknown function (DUF1588)/PA14 domain/Protein of unknown function (DUF1595)/Cytochrome C oxidase, cbb3-type, subunit III
MLTSPSPSRIRPIGLSLVLTGLITLAPTSSAFASDGSLSGEQVYRAKCASCHGPTGEGSKEYARPLVGDKSTSQLTRLIERTMPEDDPGTCVGEEARIVASYIYDNFYSKTAQARNKPARVELARLTVRQYRNALADLIGSFRESNPWDDKEHGLRGEYYKANRFRNNERIISRVDPEVKFDFGVVGPEPEKFSPQEFSISWKGSVLAPETGEFEFIVKTEHALRLWVNDNEHALIDAWVKSGNDTEYRASIYLVAGRVYPIRLDFSKGKQGVEDSKEKKAKAPAVKASVALEWKLPHRQPEVIPTGNLSPNPSPQLYVCKTPFPPDDRSVGYERGTSISKEWDQATTEAALELADYLVPRLKELAGVGPDSGDREARLRDFCLKFAERAFRRPLTPEQKERYVLHQFAAGSDLETAVKRVVLLVLKSPRFLYREVDGLDNLDVASRLSFGLWDSLPDAELLKAAGSGKLKSREQIKGQADRMVKDIRTRAKLREFLHQWLKVEHVPDLAKDPSKYPGFDPAVASDLRTSLDLFLDDVIWSESSDFRQLLLADQVFMNGRLATFYGVELPPDAPFQKVALDSGKRAGVLTHPYLLANFAYTATSSPIHRGVFIARNMLGRSLRPPPEAVSPLAPDLHASLTTRERVTLQTSPTACVTCHGMINPLGFGLENYDAVGRFRLEEKGKPVDVNGSYDPPSGEVHKYVGARELAGLLSQSDETHEAFVQQLFHHMVQQPIRAFGPRQLPDLKKSFADHQYNVRELLVEIVTASTVSPPPPPKKPPIDRDAVFPRWPFSLEK